jgi:hypothetical protein
MMSTYPIIASSMPHMAAGRPAAELPEAAALAKKFK